MQVVLFAMNASKVHLNRQSDLQSSYRLAPVHIDQACQAEADRANVPGTFVAMVSTTKHALTRHRDELPVVNSKVNN